jgi:hypothetical protein
MKTVLFIANNGANLGAKQHQYLDKTPLIIAQNDVIYMSKQH